MSGTFYDLNLDCKPDFVECMKRIYAWYEGEIMDRPPIRFSAHNAEFEMIDVNRKWDTLKDRWYDAEYQVEKFIASLNRSYLGETFPVFWPNLGPNIFAAMMGAEIEFGDVTSWTHPVLKTTEDSGKLCFHDQSEYLLKIIEMTDYALERCEHRYMVGYTDLHPSLDCLDALRGTVDLCMDMYDDPVAVHAVTEKCFEPLKNVMDLFHERLKSKRQLSVTWMNIPSYETIHIPSCDLGSMISCELFNEFALPYIRKEVQLFRHNIFHMDGKGVAKHINALLDIKEINAIQWVQGVGEDMPIMQWVPLIKKIQTAGKGVVVDLKPEELEGFMTEVRPEGIYLCMDVQEIEIQKQIIERLKQWK